VESVCVCSTWGAASHVLGAGNNCSFSLSLPAQVCRSASPQARSPAAPPSSKLQAYGIRAACTLRSSQTRPGVTALSCLGYGRHSHTPVTPTAENEGGKEKKKKTKKCSAGPKMLIADHHPISPTVAPWPRSAVRTGPSKEMPSNVKLELLAWQWQWQWQGLGLGLGVRLGRSPSVHPRLGPRGQQLVMPTRTSCQHQAT
jgi:hypothetical protein